MRISLIAAIGNNRELGLNNKLLWHLPADLKNFKQVTYGHYLLMGANTFAAIGRPLPGRISIILSRRRAWQQQHCITTDSLELALKLARDNEEQELFVIGGGDVYAQMLPLADRLYLTRVDFSGEADTFFPEFEHYAWECVHEAAHPRTAEGPAWTYQVLCKKPEPQG